MKVIRGNRRFAFLLFYVVIVLITVFAGLHFVTIYFADNPGALNQTEYDKYYVMITDDNQSVFWKSIYEGAYGYGVENGIFVEDLSSTFNNELSTEELMRVAIASNVDGIIVLGNDSEELSLLVDEAMGKGIPVVTLYNDCPNSTRISYVGVGNYSIGRSYGEQALSAARNLYNENGTENINVTVLVDQVPSSDQMMIYSTIQDVFDADALASRLSLNMYKTDSTNTFSVEETIRELFISEDVPDIIICLDELDTTCVYQAVIDYNKVGQVSILGYFDSDVILQGIDRDIIYSTIRIDTVQMGEYCVDALAEYGRVGFTSQYYVVDIEIINAYNVFEYLEGTNNEN